MNTFVSTQPRPSNLRSKHWSGHLCFAACLLVTCAASLLLVRGPILTVEVIVGVTVSVTFFRHPFWCIPVIFLLGPLGDLQHFAMGISLVKAAIVLAALGFGFQFAVRKASVQSCGLVIPLLLFVFVFCTLSVRDVHNAGNLIALLTILGYPLAFLLVLYLLTTTRRMNWVLSSFAVGTCLASLASILEEYAGYNPLVALRGFRSIDVASVGFNLERSLGLARDPNAAAYPLLLAIPLFLALGLSARTRTVRALLFAVVGISVFGLAITFSRSGYIGTAVGVLFLIFTVPARKSIRVIGAVCVLLFLALHAIPEQALTARFRLLPEQMNTPSDRWAQYQIAMHQVLHNPLTGGGTDLFLTEMTKKFSSPTIPHSNLLNIAVQSGLSGLAALLWLAVVYSRFVWRGITRMNWSPLKHCAIGSTAGLIAFSVQGLFITNMGWFLFWAMAAVPPSCILVAARQANVSVPSPSQIKGRPRRVSAPSFGS